MSPKKQGKTRREQAIRPPEGLEQGNILELRVEALSAEGQAVARLPNGEHSGLVVFIDHALPGQLVRVRLTGFKPRRAEAVRLEVLEPASDERPAACPHFGQCGGCAWQDLDYAAQVAWKRRLAGENLRRLAGARELPDPPCAPSPLEYGFRNKIELACSGQGPGFRLGFHRRGSHEVLDTPGCLLMAEPAGRLREAVARFCRDYGAPAYDPRSERGLWRFFVLRRSFFLDQCSLEVVTSADEAGFDALPRLAEQLFAAEPKLDAVVHGQRRATTQVALSEFVTRVIARDGRGRGRLVEEIDGQRFFLSPGAFFQTNSPAAALLAREVEALAGPGPFERILDVYGGCGFFGQRLANRAREVVALESGGRSVEDGEEAAALNGLTNMRFIQGPASRSLREPGLLAGADLVLVDPPRAGLEESIRRRLRREPAPRLIYVSCHPATMARDLRELLQSYELREARLVDLFPQGPHVESAALLVPR